MPLQDLTPQLRTRLSRVEHVVGLFVGLATLLLAAGFVYYVYHTAQRKGWFLTKAPYFTFVDSAAGLKVGDPVKLMGFDVGKITRIDAQAPGEYFNVYVEFELRDPYYGYIWTDGSRAKITPADFLGKRSLEVTKGTNGVPSYLFYEMTEMSVRAARATRDIQTKVFAEHFIGTNGAALTDVFQPATQPVLKQLADAGIQNVRVADYYHNVRSIEIGEALRWEDYPKMVFIDEVADPNNPQKPLVRVGRPVAKGFLEKLAGAGHKTIRIAERRPPNKIISGIWQDQYGRYDFYTNKVQKYWLLSDESPALTERADAVLKQVDEGLPGILQMTNQLATVLSNTVRLTARLDTVLSNALPVVTNVNGLVTNVDAIIADLQPTILHLQSITAMLTNSQGALGDWLIPTNLNVQLQTTLTNVNAGLPLTLSNVANLTSNLNAQLQANSNLVSNVNSLVVQTDDLIEGLKRHWLLRSAFKEKKTNAPPPQPSRKPPSRR